MTQQWRERWQLGNIGWHEQHGNTSLQKHWRATGKRVLVPLCGKSMDLLWLERQGNEVVGVELSEIAIRAFFDENAIRYKCVDGPLKTFVAEGRPITVFCGDYFEFAEGLFDAYYDRGALVALPKMRRRDYVKHTRRLLSEDAVKMLITVEYDDALVAGPPFSVPASEVNACWPELRRTDAYDDLENGPPKFRNAGLNEMMEVVWQCPV